MPSIQCSQCYHVIIVPPPTQAMYKSTGFCLLPRQESRTDLVMLSQRQASYVLTVLDLSITALLFWFFKDNMIALTAIMNKKSFDGVSVSLLLKD